MTLAILLVTWLEAEGRCTPELGQVRCTAQVEKFTTMEECQRELAWWKRNQREPYATSLFKGFCIPEDVAVKGGNRS